MNAHVNFSGTASAIAIAGANIVAFRPRPEPEVIDAAVKAADALPRAALVEAAAEAVALVELVDEAPEPVEEESEPAEPEPVKPMLPTSAVVERAGLTRALDVIFHAVEHRNTIPILSNARLAGVGDHLAVTATDLDIEITVAVPAAVDSDFATTLPAKMLRDLMKKATASDHVAFTDHRDGKATADFERVNYKLQTLPVADFPDLKAGTFSHSFTLPGAVLWDAIDATMAAMSDSETRYYLNGIFMHHVEPRAIDAYHGDRGGLRMVATDGHRLYRQQVDAPEGCEGMSGVIIPRKVITIMHKLTKGKACPESVLIDVSESKIRYTFDGITITSKLIDGTFPDYHRVIPTGNDKPATFDPETMLEAVRAVTLISSERGRAVKMDFADGNCQLRVNNPDMGSASADVPCDFGSDPVEIGFSAGYLVDAIPTASPDGGKVTITLADAGSPTLVTGSRKGWLGVLMPMRV